MSVHLSLTLRRVAATVLLTATVGLLAGCGSSHTTGTAVDPASAVPASATLYATAVVRPDGALKTAALAAGRALTGQPDPYLALLRALQTPGAPALDFKRDIAPWLGAHAGIFLSSLDSSGRLLSLLEAGLLGSSAGASAFPFGAQAAQGAIVLDTRDAGKARSFLDAQAERAGARATSYRGVAYRVSSAGVAFGAVDRLAVLGSESGLHSVVDTTLGGPSLLRAPGYAKLLAAAPSGALAHVYSSPGAATPSGQGSTGPSPSGSSAGGGGLAGLLRLLAGARQLDASFVPSATSIGLDADVLASNPATVGAASSGGLLASGPEGALALGELPGESWLAIGLGNVGATLGEDVQGLRALASLGGATPEAATPGISLKGLFGGILAPLSALGANTAEARSAFASWMGSGGIFASGSGLLDLKAGVVISSKNPALSRAAVSKLGAALVKAGGSVQPVSIAGTDAAVAARLTGLPVVLDIADGRDANGHTRFVIGIGEASVAAALNPTSALSAAPAYGAAAAALGGTAKPSVMIDFPTLLSLLEGVGLSEDPTISKFVPYLRALTTLAGGETSVGSGIERFRLLLGLRPAR